VFKLYDEVDSVKNTTINIWINDPPLATYKFIDPIDIPPI